MHILAAAATGLVFGTGLVLAGFVNPAVVLGFLDILGDWNPALLFGMGAALIVALPGYRLVLPRKPLLAEAHALPTASAVDRPLLLGAVLFGLGWGLAGICPGPAVTLLALAPGAALLFLVPMAGGMLLVRQIGRGGAAPFRRAPTTADG